MGESANTVEEKQKAIESGVKGGKLAAGGLLANVSLLTTGGSSLQQQLTQNDTLRNAGELPLESKSGKKNFKGTIDTSTPARPFANTNVVYGFDLSPVHSYDIPSSAHDQDTNENQSPEASKEALIASVQDRIEDDLFIDSKSKSAPNFMQASLVLSPHQSRISNRSDKHRSDDTETMMSQVYSPSSKPKATTRSPRPTKKKSSPSVGSNRSMHGLSPRKSSKTYAHIQGSGYGVISPWKLTTGNKINQPESKSKKKAGHGSKKKNKFKTLKRETVISISPHSEQPQVSQGKKSMKISENSVLKHPMATYKIDLEDNQSIVKGTSADLTFENTHEEQLSMSRKGLSESENLDKKYIALEKECSRLKAHNEDVNRENFLLSAKLNKLIDVGESADPPIKDSLNENRHIPSGSTEIQQLKKEMLEQEKLLKGYHQENEKLYAEVTKLKTKNKENEAAMFDENLKLKHKLAALKEELNIKDSIIKDKNHLLKDQNNVQPRVFTKAVQTEKDSRNELNSLEKEEKPHQMQALQEKIAWYKKTQAILEERCDGLNHASTEMSDLKLQVKAMKREIEEKSTSSLKKIQTIEDLRRQVRELENITTRSLTSDNVKGLIHGSNEAALLEQRCKHLELQLKEQEEKSSQSMKSLHQLYKKMSADYESRVNDLSRQLEIIKNRSWKSPSKVHKPSHDESALRENEQLKSQNEILRQQNQQSKIQLESLLQQLMNQKQSEKVKSPTKKKKSKVPEGVSYNPGYFTDHRDLEEKSEDNHLKAEEITRLQESMNNVKTELFKEISHWKKLYEDAKTSNDSLKSRQDLEIESLKITNAKSLTDLRNSISMLESKLSNADSQLSRVQVDLASSKACENALQLQIKNLLDELHETRRGSPNVALRHLEALQSQVRALDFRQKTREDKLNRVVAASADEYLKAEIDSLQGVISEKNLLLSKFRYELDTILQVLETLQKKKHN